MGIMGGKSRRAAAIPSGSFDFHAGPGRPSLGKRFGLLQYQRDRVSVSIGGIFVFAEEAFDEQPHSWRSLSLGHANPDRRLQLLLLCHPVPLPE